MIGGIMPTVLPPPHDTPAEWSNRTVADVLALGNLLLGTLILYGGAARLSGMSFLYVIQVAPWWTWGVLLILAGALSLIGQFRRIPRAARVGHSIAGTICLFWVFAFIAGAVQNKATSLTGIAAYLIIGILHCWVAAVLVPTRPRR